MSKVFDRIRDEVIELEKYVNENKKNLKRLREECEKEENINKQFTNYIEKRNFCFGKRNVGNTQSASSTLLTI